MCVNLSREGVEYPKRRRCFSSPLPDGCDSFRSWSRKAVPADQITTARLHAIAQGRASLLAAPGHHWRSAFNPFPERADSWEPSIAASPRLAAALCSSPLAASSRRSLITLPPRSAIAWQPSWLKRTNRSPSARRSLARRTRTLFKRGRSRHRPSLS